LKHHTHMKPSDINISSGLAGSGHVVARAIVARIVKINQLKNDWTEFKLQELLDLCPERKEVVMFFIEEFVLSKKLLFDVESGLCKVTQMLMKDCELSQV